MFREFYITSVMADLMILALPVVALALLVVAVAPLVVGLALPVVGLALPVVILGGTLLLVLVEIMVRK